MKESGAGAQGSTGPTFGTDGDGGGDCGGAGQGNPARLRFYKGYDPVLIGRGGEKSP